MRKIKKKLKKPLRPWDKTRIEQEKKLLEKYGLRRKKEIWKAESILRNYRRRARDITAKRDEKAKKILLEKLYKTCLLSKQSKLADVLSLTVENLLDRRLQTLVFTKELANTPKHARQLITHGYIAINDRKVSFPSLLVDKEVENKISYYKNTPQIQKKVKQETKEVKKDSIENQKTKEKR